MGNIIPFLHVVYSSLQGNIVAVFSMMDVIVM